MNQSMQLIPPQDSVWYFNEPNSQNKNQYPLWSLQKGTVVPSCYRELSAEGSLKPVSLGPRQWPIATLLSWPYAVTFATTNDLLGSHLSMSESFTLIEASGKRGS